MMAKKASKPKKPKAAKPAWRYKVIVHTSDCNWWGDLHNSLPENDPDWHEQNGWEIVEDDPVDNKDYPDIDRRVKLKRPDTSGTEPIIYIDMF